MAGSRGAAFALKRRHSGIAQCRVNLAAKYWADVVEPTINSMLPK